MSSLPPEALLWSLLRGALGTQALRVVANYRIADMIEDGILTVAEMSATANADEDALYRFLRALASEGVFAEEEPGVFRNTPASELLRTGGKERWNEFALQFGGSWYAPVGEAAHAARTGEPTFPRVWDDSFEVFLRKHPGELALFNSSMEAGAAERISSVAALAWSDETVVDVGGGTGRMLSELLRLNPGLQGVLFDLPEVVAAAAVPEHCEVVGGDFLESVPAGDAYVVSRILHGLDDEKAERVLANIRAAARPGARVLLIEAVIPAGNAPNGSKWLDLLMLVLSGGRERTEEQWLALLEDTGLEPISITDGLIQAHSP
jgi:SAM-dependent methyltransferase